MPMYGLAGAYRQISPALISSILDQVRTRVLGLALDLEKVAPQAGEPGATVTDPVAVNNIVNTFIFGHGNTLAVDSPSAVQLGGVQVNDLQSLLTAVAALGFSTEDVTELQRAIEADQADESTPKGKPGSRVAQFLGKVSLGTLKAAGQTGVQEVSKAVSKMVMTHYGIT